ncbi:ricin-type beta-trefoil lectin domain protein [Streptomyces niveiscabiei]|uniref:RICIN domain-containing protein n=1 Tax=Streptomyces niveiscabiei TaxID=164115 RepID=UPI0029A9DE93|nr:ricin-type beta-trefoil lectin domain protein [Streptomyces niveiscabiei]MDX3386093.1 ricin-type beta-trefoil lectin domain protein [Streptomyces niveiscabiei]
MMMSEKLGKRSARRGWAAVLALGLTLGFSLFNAGPASASVIVQNTLIRNWETGMCLEWNPAGSDYVITGTCNFETNVQRWDVEFQYHANYDVVTIKTRSGKALTWTNDFTSVKTLNYVAGSSNQQFAGVGSSWDQVQLTDVSTRRCLDSNRVGQTYGLGCNGGGYQKWKLGY